MMRYEFGKNWTQYIEQHFSEERVTLAQESMLRFLNLKNLKGKKFLDIGCGSGIHSLAAYRAGADQVTSFDFDLDSVSITRRLHERSGSPNNWFVAQGSVLDGDFLETLPLSDIVYSWGVLHHTGEMWKAIENAAGRLERDGVFFIALYTSDVFIDPTPEYWLKVKQTYNRSSWLGKRRMEWTYALRATIIPYLRRGWNPLRHMLSYKRSRGMSYWTDVKDWLGGWPMEFAGIAETKAFCLEKLGMELLNIHAGEANTEYLFRKAGVKNYWDEVIGTQERESLPGPFTHQQGYAWVAPIPHLEDRADSIGSPKQSTLMLYEDGVPLGFSHAPHSHIEQLGTGRYSHWGHSLIFSTTDNSNPNRNGRRYTICPSMVLRRAGQGTPT